MLFTRIHSLKFQNKVAKDSLKRTIKAIGDESLEKGLYFYTFIDIDETNLYVINTWDNEKSSKKVHSVYEDFLKQVKEMGVKMVIVGGSSETSYSNATILDNFTKINGRNPRLHELMDQFEGQIKEDFLKKMIEEIYHKKVEDEIDV